MADDSNEIEQALKALPAAPKRKNAATIVREHRGLLRQRRDEGVNDDDLLAFVNSRAAAPITLITLRCYLSRRTSRSDVAYEPIPARSAVRRDGSNVASSSQFPADIRAPSQSNERQPARTEQRGITQSIKPGPVE